LVSAEVKAASVGASNVTDDELDVVKLTFNLVTHSSSFVTPIILEYLEIISSTEGGRRMFLTT
jgi:hypothetical protein